MEGNDIAIGLLVIGVIALIARNVIKDRKKSGGVSKAKTKQQRK